MKWPTTGRSAAAEAYLPSDLHDDELKLGADEQNAAMELVLVPFDGPKLMVGFALDVLGGFCADQARDTQFKAMQARCRHRHELRMPTRCPKESQQLHRAEVGNLHRDSLQPLALCRWKMVRCPPSTRTACVYADAWGGARLARSVRLSRPTDERRCQAAASPRLGAQGRWLHSSWRGQLPEQRDPKTAQPGCAVVQVALAARPQPKAGQNLHVPPTVHTGPSSCKTAIRCTPAD